MVDSFSFHVDWNLEQDLGVYEASGLDAKEVYLWNYLFSGWVLYFIERLDCFIEAVAMGQSYATNGSEVVPVEDGPMIHPRDVRLAKVTFDSVVDAKFEAVMMALKDRGALISNVGRVGNADDMPQVASVEVEDGDVEIRQSALAKFVLYARMLNRIMTNMMKEIYYHYRVRVYNRRFVVKTVEHRLREYKACVMDFYYDTMLKGLTVK
jgi:hypothetical protein